MDQRKHDGIAVRIRPNHSCGYASAKLCQRVTAVFAAASCTLSVAGPAALAEGVPASSAVLRPLPQDLSPMAMFLNADWVVQSIFVGLAIASVVTWTVGLAKAIEITTARRRERRTRAAMAGAATLDDARRHLASSRSVALEMLDCAHDELTRSAGGHATDGINARSAMALQRIEARHARRAQKGTGVLATIAATAPFVGLFGTVWGIMNSFVGISKMQTTNLAVVAPGIAEALLATAIGLVAAIPAVIVYNALARAIAAYRATLADTATQTMRLLGRDLDRLAISPARLPRAAE
jgi:biopolymer transport protein ExbB